MIDVLMMLTPLSPHSTLTDEGAAGDPDPTGGDGVGAAALEPARVDGAPHDCREHAEAVGGGHLDPRVRQVHASGGSTGRVGPRCRWVPRSWCGRPRELPGLQVDAPRVALEIQARHLVAVPLQSHRRSRWRSRRSGRRGGRRRARRSAEQSLSAMPNRIPSRAVGRRDGVAAQPHGHVARRDDQSVTRAGQIGPQHHAGRDRLPAGVDAHVAVGQVAAVHGERAVGDAEVDVDDAPRRRPGSASSAASAVVVEAVGVHLDRRRSGWSPATGRCRCRRSTCRWPSPPGPSSGRRRGPRS